MITYIQYFATIREFLSLSTEFKKQQYYGALFHELVHCTGHNERLSRKELLESKGFGTEDYAIEELTDYIQKENSEENELMPDDDNSKNKKKI